MSSFFKEIGKQREEKGERERVSTYVCFAEEGGGYTGTITEEIEIMYNKIMKEKKRMCVCE